LARSKTPEDYETPVPYDISKVEEKFKLSLQNMEKRFVDLEVNISELSNNVKALSGAVENKQFLEETKKTVDDLTTRIEDSEDLVMVEQAGILELKKMLEGLEGRLDTKVLEDKIKEVENVAKTAIENLEKNPQIPSEVTERINLLEKDVTNLKVKPEVEHVSYLEIGELRKNLKALDGKIESMRFVLDGLKKEMFERMKSQPGQPTLNVAELDLINSKMNSLKAGVDILSDKRVETDLKLNELRDKIEFLRKESEKSPAQQILNDMKAQKHEIERSKIQIESLERVVRQLTADINNVENIAEKFESLDRLTDLKKEVDDKIKNFRFAEEEVRRLSERMELMYNDLDKRIMSMRNVERDMKKITDDFGNFRKEFEATRLDVKNRVERKDLVAAQNSTQSAIQSMVDGKINQTNQQINQISQAFESATKALENRTRNQISSQIGANYSEVQSKVGELAKRLDGFSNELLNAYKDVKDAKNAAQDAKTMKNEIVGLKNEINGMKGIVVKLAESAKSAEKAVELLKREEGLPKEMKIVINDLGMRMSELENSLAKVNSAVSNFAQRAEFEKAIVVPQDAEIKELIDKIVFLESRLAAMEITFERQPQPIILE